MALIVVLFFVMLVTGLILAFFSRSVSESQISENYYGEVQTDIFAQGAVDLIRKDLQSEIVASSTATTISVGSGTSTIFAPKNPWNAVPTRLGISSAIATTGTYNFPSLIRTSGSDLTQFNILQNSGIIRVSSISTSTPTIQGRSVARERWNAPMLLPTVSGSIHTDFVAPYWIYITRSGSCVVDQNGSIALQNKVKGSDPIIGRFAFTMYDEGGLLDINVAGYPSIASDEKTWMQVEIGKKGTLGTADLQQIGLTQPEVDKIVKWRNASATSGSNYLRTLRTATNGFLTVSGSGDRAFVTRKQLLKFFHDSLPAKTNALQSLGTFTRGLNQPSFGSSGPTLQDPAASFPSESSGAYSLTVPYVGNNRVDPVDQRGINGINPRLLEVRVTGTGFPRFTPAQTTGTIWAKAGEPLVAKRFPLDRLAWLTYRGPIVSNGTLISDPVVTALLDAGYTTSFLQLGTKENIKQAFGLAWTNVNGRNIWVYDHGSSGNICRLSEVAALSREPDFLELLKASTHVGSLGKGSAALGALWDHGRAIQTDIQLLQIFANIIDQFDADSFPSEIAVPAPGPMGLYERRVRGIEDLPMIYGVAGGAITLKDANPALPTGKIAYDITKYRQVINNAPVVSGDGTITSGTVSIKDQGKGALFLHHWLWNPHSIVSGSSVIGPTQFRIISYSGYPNYLYDGETTNSVSAVINQEIIPGAARSSVGAGANTNLWGFSHKTSQTNALTPYVMYPLGERKSELLFELPGNDVFRQPTAMVLPNIPAGTNLRTGPSNSIKDVAEGESFGGGYALKDLANTRYLGTLLSTFPMRDIIRMNGSIVGDSLVTGTSYLLSANWAYFMFRTDQAGNNIYAPVTSLLQYKDGSSWVTCDIKCAGNRAGSTALFDPALDPANPLILSFAGRPSPLTDAMSASTGIAVWSDPRTSRFGSSNFGTIYSPPSFAVTDLNKAEFSTLRQDNTSNGLQAVNSFWPGSANPPASASLIAKLQTAFTGTNASISGFYPALLDRNTTDAVASQVTLYQDPDKWYRGAMARFSLSSSQGLPQTTGQQISRPILLNRPLRSVAELGYVFRDLPWKQIDFYNPESGDSALLDAFCVQEEVSSDSLVAGKVNLNTRNPEVLAAVIAGVSRNTDGKSTLGTTVFTGTVAEINGTEAFSLSRGIIGWSTSTSTGRGPFTSLGDLVGRFWKYSDNTESYESFFQSNPAPFSTSVPENNILQRYREASVRALADVGEVRVWNLMIDVVAQTGICSPVANSLDKFSMRGETRRWIHIAIDRATGQVIDQQTEPVNE